MKLSFYTCDCDCEMIQKTSCIFLQEFLTVFLYYRKRPYVHKLAVYPFGGKVFLVAN